MIKQFFINIWEWTKKKTKQVLIVLGILGVSLAAGTQTTILDTSPINYPLTANTGLEKMEFLYQAEESLRLQHNEIGTQFRNGYITKEEWLDYLEHDFDQNSKWLGWAISTVGETLEDVELNSTTTPAREFYKPFMIKSDKYKIDIDKILK